MRTREHRHSALESEPITRLKRSFEWNNKCNVLFLKLATGNLQPNITLI